MISRTDLEEKYAGYSNEELLDVVLNKEGYTEIAVEQAQAELTRRNVSGNEISQMVTERDKAEFYIVKNARANIRFWQKCFFYFIWVPLLHFAIKQNLREDGYERKVKQAGYYSIMGFVFFILAGISSGVVQEYLGLPIWALGLFVAILLEKFFVRH